MKKIIYLILLFVALIIGCATKTISTDMKFNNWGYDLICKGLYEDAEKYLKQALVENPENPYALLNLGVVYQNTGNPEKARVMYEKVIGLNPKSVANRSNHDGKAGKTLVELAKENLQKL